MKHPSPLHSPQEPKLQAAASKPRPTVLFGAFDRHNFGDLLFPHILARMLAPAELHFAGLAARDLRLYGGHRVAALAQLAARIGQRPLRLIHVGGELLSCDAWQAAVMLLPPQRALAIALRLAEQPAARQAWAQRQLGSAALAPYATAGLRWPAARVFYNAVGGFELERCAPDLRAEVLAQLRAAADVSVRERHTQALLQACGVGSRLLPDPAVMVAALFGRRIRRHGRRGELAQLRTALAPGQGYLAVQFSSEFGDDHTLESIAAQLDQFALAHGLAVVFFRAGAAPWHDDLGCYRRCAARMRTPVRLFASLNLWDICALIAGSRAYAGSSLHGRIVAMAYALPRINLQPPPPAAQPSKAAAYAATWEAPGTPATVAVDALADGLALACAVDAAQLQRTAGALALRYRQGFLRPAADD